MTNPQHPYNPESSVNPANAVDPNDQPSNLNFRFKPLKSSILSGYTYNDQDYILTVQFAGKTQSIYQYFNVFPTVISEVFDSGGSIGSKFTAMIKRGGYLSNKLV